MTRGRRKQALALLPPVPPPAADVDAAVLERVRQLLPQARRLLATNGGPVQPDDHDPHEHLLVQVLANELATATTARLPDRILCGGCDDRERHRMKHGTVFEVFWHRGTADEGPGSELRGVWHYPPTNNVEDRVRLHLDPFETLRFSAALQRGLELALADSRQQQLLFVDDERRKIALHWRPWNDDAEDFVLVFDCPSPGIAESHGCRWCPETAHCYEFSCVQVFALAANLRRRRGRSYGEMRWLVPAYRAAAEQARLYLEHVGAGAAS